MSTVRRLYFDSTYKRRYHLEYSVEVVPGESEAPIKSVLYYDDSSWVCQVKVFTKITG